MHIKDFLNEKITTYGGKVLPRWKAPVYEYFYPLIWFWRKLRGK